ncbi:hypothetical protein N9B05_02285 [Mariniblastus sp.]|nr:hypothetical protein [Mariniblastus sp.]
MSKKDVTNLVQRLDAFEERLGVRIDSMSAFEVNDEYGDEADITIRGELHVVNGTSLEDDIYLRASIYDVEGRVVETSYDYIMSDSFFGFHTFEISLSVEPRIAKRIRLLPSRS